MSIMNITHMGDIECVDQQQEISGHKQSNIFLFRWRMELNYLATIQSFLHSPRSSIGVAGGYHGGDTLIGIKHLGWFYSEFFNGHQKVVVYSSGLKGFYALKHVEFFHFVWVILIFDF